MVYFGHIRNGKVELDQATPLPEGMLVRVEPVVAPSKADTAGSSVEDPLDGLGTEAVDAGPEDWSSEHDHYVYGSPKRNKKD